MRNARLTVIEANSIDGLDQSASSRPDVGVGVTGWQGGRRNDDSTSRHPATLPPRAQRVITPIPITLVNVVARSPVAARSVCGSGARSARKGPGARRG